MFGDTCTWGTLGSDTRVLFNEDCCTLGSGAVVWISRGLREGLLLDFGISGVYLVGAILQFQ